ncbi:DNA mismatch repair protein Mlh1 [Balamuthia mandrillaris]
MHRLPDSAIRAIRAGPVIVDVHSVVKELVENAIDGGATRITLRLESGGLRLVEVKDNGRGIAREELSQCALEYTTSKLRDYEDITNLQTFGFRGEALNSISATGQLTIITRTAEDEKAVSATFDAHGHMLTCTEVTQHTEVGTTVRVTNLFERFVVRQKRQKTTTVMKLQTKKIQQTIRGYAIAFPSLCFSLFFPPSPDFIKLPVADMGEAIKQIFTTKVFGQLSHIDFHSPDSNYRFTGYIPSPQAIHRYVTRSSSDRYFLWINKRPVDIPSIAKLLNHAVRTRFDLPSGRYPFIALNVTVAASSYDINCSPDKRTIVLHEETEILSHLQQFLEDFYPPRDERDEYAQSDRLSLTQDISLSYEQTAQDNILIVRLGGKSTQKERDDASSSSSSSTSQFMHEGGDEPPTQPYLPTRTTIEDEPEEEIEPMTQVYGIETQRPSNSLARDQNFERLEEVVGGEEEPVEDFEESIPSYSTSTPLPFASRPSLDSAMMTMDSRPRSRFSSSDSSSSSSSSASTFSSTQQHWSSTPKRKFDAFLIDDEEEEEPFSLHRQDRSSNTNDNNNNANKAARASVDDVDVHTRRDRDSFSASSSGVSSSPSTRGPSTLLRMAEGLGQEFAQRMRTLEQEEDEERDIDLFVDINAISQRCDRASAITAKLDLLSSQNSQNENEDNYNGTNHAEPSSSTFEVVGAIDHKEATRIPFHVVKSGKALLLLNTQHVQETLRFQQLLSSSVLHRFSVEPLPTPIPLTVDRLLHAWPNSSASTVNEGGATEKIVTTTRQEGRLRERIGRALSLLSSTKPQAGRGRSPKAVLLANGFDVGCDDEEAEGVPHWKGVTKELDPSYGLHDLAKLLDALLHQQERRSEEEEDEEAELDRDNLWTEQVKRLFEEEAKRFAEKESRNLVEGAAVKNMLEQLRKERKEWPEVSPRGQTLLRFLHTLS